MKSFLTFIVTCVVAVAGNCCLAQTWVLQTSGVTQFLNSASFTDANNGTVTGNFGKILRTTNGGATWIQQSSGSTTAILPGVSFTDSLTGTIVGSNGIILRTTNAGATWTPQTSGVTGMLWSVSFTSTNTGVAVGNFGTILRTTNGGSTWVPQTSGTTEDLYNVDFSDPNNGTAVGANGTILRTTNGGITWTAQVTGTNMNLNSVSFPDANNGWIVGTSPTSPNMSAIMRTTNGGALWTTQLLNTTGPAMVRADFADASNGIVVAHSGTILRTTNGGTNWVPQTSPTTQNLYGISFPNVNAATAVGANGTIVRMNGTQVGCPQPTGVAVTSVTSSSATVSWSAPTGVTSFQYVVDQTATAPSTAGTSIAGTSVNLNSLNAGTNYYVHVRSACSGGNFSSWVNTPFTTTATTACTAPATVTTSAVTANSATLSWAAVTGATGYEYAVTTTTTPPATGTVVTATSVIKTGLTASTNYYAHVRTKCGGVSSTWTLKAFSTTNPTEISDINGKPSVFEVFPNPAGDIVNIRSTGAGEVRITDLRGAVLKEVRIGSIVLPLDVSDLAAGVYFIRLSTGAGSEVQKLHKK